MAVAMFVSRPGVVLLSAPAGLERMEKAELHAVTKQ